MHQTACDLVDVLANPLVPCLPELLGDKLFFVSQRTVTIKSAKYTKPSRFYARSKRSYVTVTFTGYLPSIH